MIIKWTDLDITNGMPPQSLSLVRKLMNNLISIVTITIYCNT